MIGLDGFVSELAMDLLDCLQQAMDTQAEPPAEVCFVPGEDGRLFLSAGLAEDRCCAGFAWVRVARIAPQIPQPGEDIRPCGVTTWAVDLEMGAARCSPVGDQAAGPTCQEMLDTALLTMQDAAAMRRAWCCWAPLVDSGVTAIGEWAPFGPDGMCVGGTMPVTAYVDHCEC